MRAAAVVLACLALTACGSQDNATWPEAIPPCAQEDSAGPCYWDAGEQGNGGGRSFWVDDKQHVHYLEETP